MEPIVCSNYRVIDNVEIVDVTRNDMKTNYTVFVVNSHIYLENGEQANTKIEEIVLEYILAYYKQKATNERKLAFQQLLEKERNS